MPLFQQNVGGSNEARPTRHVDQQMFDDVTLLYAGWVKMINNVVTALTGATNKNCAPRTINVWNLSVLICATVSTLPPP